MDVAMRRIIAYLMKVYLLLKYRDHSLIVGSRSIIYPSARIEINSRHRGAVQIGQRSAILGELVNYGHGGTISIGDYCFVGRDSHIWAGAEISIGNRVLISHAVNIFDNLTHPISASQRHEQFRAIMTSGHPPKLDLGEKPIRIEDDVLIGCGSIIFRGVTIGQGAIVGAGSIVRKDVPPWTIVAGNPAVVVRTIPSDER